MIKIGQKFVEAVNKATTAEDLSKSLQNAIELEHATIPVYLTALYSLKPGSNLIVAQTLREIVLDEMLHMAIAANIMVAIGGSPKIVGEDFVPRYPSTLPMGINSDLKVGLTPISRAAIEKTYMEIERPETNREFPVVPLGEVRQGGPEFATIGLFYAAVKTKILELGDNIFTVGSLRQVLDLPWSRSDKLFAIDDAASAIRALDIIVRQGEGNEASPLTFSGRASHFYRFQEILRGRILKTDDTVPEGFSFSGDPIEFDEDAVWDIPSNPSLTDYQEGSRERAAVLGFASLYSELLTILDQAFNGEPERAKQSLTLMYRLRLEAEKLTADGLGLVFDYVESSLAGFSWRPTNAPVASSRTDDIWFSDEDTGWAVNSNGQILKTADGGATWTEQLQAQVYWRCIGFADEDIGWVGSLTQNNRLFATKNGGDSWSRVSSLPEIPAKICGMSVVDRETVVCSGTNEPSDRAAVLITKDGGETWTIRDMGDHATLLVDNYFVSADEGWVVGGYSDKPNPDRPDMIPVVLYTEDGGENWVNLVEGIRDSFRAGEWGWKIHFVNEKLAFISLESFDWAAILRSDDGGRTWTRYEVNDVQGNANIEGIGFVDENTGWVGGWGDAQFMSGRSSVSVDSGRNWFGANEIGRFVNRFRFIGDPVKVGYASGWTVYKYSKMPVPPPLTPDERRLIRQNDPMEVGGDLELPIVVPAGARRLRIEAYTRFGAYAASILDEFGPKSGPRTVTWGFVWRRGRQLDPGMYIIRVTADGTAESQLVRFLGHGSQPLPPVKVEHYVDLAALFDDLVGGPDEPIRAHGAFWRTMTRDEFVAGSFAGINFVKPGDGNGSGIVKALRGEEPFGVDVGTQGGTFRRMPAGGEKAKDDVIRAIAEWIDVGAPE